MKMFLDNLLTCSMIKLGYKIQGALFIENAVIVLDDANFDSLHAKIFQISPDSNNEYKILHSDELKIPC